MTIWLKKFWEYPFQSLIPPRFAKEDQIVAIPTLIRKNYSGKKIVGDLSNIERVLVGLDIRLQVDLEVRHAK